MSTDLKEIYILAGHGCDLEKAIKIPMPDNVFYITKTKCGMAGEMYSSFEVIDIIKTYTNIEQIKDIEGKKDIYVNYSKSPKEIRRSYINGIFIPMLDIIESNNIGLYLSGLINIKTTNIYFKDEDEEDENYNKIPINFLVTGTNSVDVNNEPIETNEPYKYIVSKAYENSLYPTQEEVLKILEKYNPDSADDKDKKSMFKLFKNEVINTYKIKYSDLFTLFPGVYYSYLCRSPCNKYLPANIDESDFSEHPLIIRQKQESIGGKKRKTNIINKTQTKFNKKTRKNKTKTKKLKKIKIIKEIY